jgi:hypothetical protein
MNAPPRLSSAVSLRDMGIRTRRTVQRVILASRGTAFFWFLTEVLTMLTNRKRRACTISSLERL